MGRFIKAIFITLGVLATLAALFYAVATSIVAAVIIFSLLAIGIIAMIFMLAFDSLGWKQAAIRREI